MDKVKKYGPLILFVSIMIIVTYVVIALVSQEYPMNQMPGVDWAIATSIFLAIMSAGIVVFGRIQVFNRSDLKEIKEDLEGRRKVDDKQNSNINVNNNEINILKNRVDNIERNQAVFRKEMKEDYNDFRSHIQSDFKEFKELILQIKNGR